MMKKQQFLNDLKSKKKKLTTNDILEYAIKAGIDIKEAFDEVRDAFNRNELTIDTLDQNVLKITHGNTLKEKIADPTIRQAFEREVDTEYLRLVKLQQDIQSDPYKKFDVLKKTSSADELMERYPEHKPETTKSIQSPELKAMMKPHLRRD